MKKFGFKEIIFTLGIVLFILISFVIPAPAMLVNTAELAGSSSRQAMCAIGGLAFAICGWVSGVFADWIVGMLTLCIWAITTKLSFTTVFAGFHGTSFWMIFGAFCLSSAVSKSGLLSRIALSLMSLFPASYKGQILAQMSVGTIVSPLLPSSTAKVALSSNLSNSISDLMGYKDYSSERTGIFIASWVGFGIMSTIFLSASFIPYSYLAATPEPYCNMTWIEYFIMMLPWGIVMFVGMTLALLLFYKPKEDVKISQEELASIKSDLGPVKSKEKITALIISACLVFWILEKQLGVSSSIVAIIGGILCFMCGILDRKDINSLPWGLLLFVGVILNISTILDKTGVTGWLVTLLSPLVSNVHSELLFVTIIWLVSIILRFMIASQTAAGVLVISIFCPIALQLGISPLAIVASTYAANNIWIMKYQAPTYLTAIANAEGHVKHSDTLKASLTHLAISLIGCFISVPFWSMFGFI